MFEICLTVRQLQSSEASAESGLLHHNLHVRGHSESFASLAGAWQQGDMAIFKVRSRRRHILTAS